jgi:hypothetical protein
LIASAGNDPSAFGGEPERDGAANAARSAGDQRNLVL